MNLLYRFLYCFIFLLLPFICLLIFNADMQFKLLDFANFSANIFIVFNHFHICLSLFVSGVIIGARIRIQSKIQRRKIHHRAGPHDQREWLGLIHSLNLVEYTTIHNHKHTHTYIIYKNSASS